MSEGHASALAGMFIVLNMIFIMSIVYHLAVMPEKRDKSDSFWEYIFFSNPLIGLLLHMPTIVIDCVVLLGLAGAFVGSFL